MDVASNISFSFEMTGDDLMRDERRGMSVALLQSMGDAPFASEFAALLVFSSKGD